MDLLTLPQLAVFPYRSPYISLLPRLEAEDTRGGQAIARRRCNPITLKPTLTKVYLKRSSDDGYSSCVQMALQQIPEDHLAGDGGETSLYGRRN